MKHLTQLALFALALSGAWLVSDSADAQARSSGGGGGRVIQLDEIHIEGQVQRPNAFYILNRSSLGYEVLDLRTSFTRDILRSVGSEPF
jgi:hypothetical protein